MSGRARQFIDYERNARWTRAAVQAAKLHDAFLDILKIFNGIDLDVSQDCRALANSKPEPLCRAIDAAVKECPDYDIRECLVKVAAEHKKHQDGVMQPDSHDKLRDAFVAFAENQDLRLVPTDQEQYGTRQLKVESRRALPKYVKQATTTGNALRGLVYVLFPLPDDDDPQIDGILRINDDLVTHRPNGAKYLQLGPASLLNHHCAKQNVLPTGTTQAKGLLDMGLVHQPTLIHDVPANTELLINYGPDWFDDVSKPCRCSASTHLHETVSQPARKGRSRKRSSHLSVQASSFPTLPMADKPAKRKRLKSSKPALAVHTTSMRAADMTIETPPIIDPSSVTEKPDAQVVFSSPVGQTPPEAVTVRKGADLETLHAAEEIFMYGEDPDKHSTAAIELAAALQHEWLAKE